jgi:hypothetical protein
VSIGLQLVICGDAMVVSVAVASRSRPRNPSPTGSSASTHFCAPSLSAFRSGVSMSLFWAASAIKAKNPGKLDYEDVAIGAGDDAGLAPVSRMSRIHRR